MMESNR